MEYITTKRGGRALIYQGHCGHRYVINRRGRDGRIFWRCGVSRLCSGAVTTMLNEILSQRDIHNHPPDVAEIEAEKIVCRLKAAVKESIRSVPTIYHEHIQAIASLLNNEEVAAKMPTFDQIRTSLYDSRRERLPTLPQTRGDVSFTGEWTKTSSGDQFLIADDGYGNDNNMKLLCESHTIHVDGTFQTCPNIYDTCNEVWQDVSTHLCIASQQNNTDVSETV